MKTVLVATDSFKNSITAERACAAISRGWRAHRPGDRLIELPQADGGEGTLSAIGRSVPGSRRRTVGTVTGPAGSPVPGTWLQLPNGTAVIELAQTSGLELMPDLDPINATTRGLGEVIAAALDDGADRLIIALGGSASTDGGVGALEAIGERRVPPRGAMLLTDVDNPLLGPRGAARIFAPQKGASPEQVLELEERLTAYAREIGSDPSVPGTGAAGGTAYGLRAWGARIVPGAQAIADLSGLTSKAATADLIITGEGRFDDQSLSGKVVGNALRLPATIAVIAGRIDLPVTAWSASLTALAGSADAAMTEPEAWLELAGKLAAEAHFTTSGSD